MTKARRNLILQSISGNKIVRNNFETSVLIPYNEDKEGYWGGSSKPQNPASKKESKFKKYVYDKLQKGDVIIFSDKNEVKHAGIITGKIADVEEIKRIGWQSGPRPYDLAFAIKKVSIHIPNILNNCIDYQNIPRNTVIVSKNKDKKFWEEFLDIIEQGGINPPEIIEEDSSNLLESSVYIFGKVKDGKDGPARIGFAGDVEKRMDSHDGGDYEELILYGTFVSPNGNGRELETRIHDKLKKVRITKTSWKGKEKRTEWFETEIANALKEAKEQTEYMKRLYS